MSFRVQFTVRVFVCGALTLAATNANAQELTVTSASAIQALPARTLSPLFTQSTPLTTTVRTERAPAPRLDAGSDRGVLVPLYASFAALQMLDAHSTIRAVRAGGAESNPMMAGFADKPAALVALKAGVAVSTIALADKFRGRSRVGAIVLMAVLNSAYATVVAHNYRTIP
jgi:hypothetical protein